MRSLWESGLRHVIAGESTMDELLRVTDVPMEQAKAPPQAGPVAPARDAGASPGGRRRAHGRTRRRRPAGGPPAPSPLPSLDFTMDMELVDGPSPPSSRDGPGRGTKVLLVEDEEPLRRVMRICSSARGMWCPRRGTAFRRWTRLIRHAPDVIVLDLNLPGLDGYSVLQQLRSRPATGTFRSWC